MKPLIITVVLLLSAVSISPVLAWNDEKTHPTISDFSATQYFGEDFMKKKINDIEVRDLIRQGSILEDTGTLWQFLGGTARSLNHFHNASKATFAEARLTDVPSFMPIGGSPIWESTPLWAQDGDNQRAKVNGDWSLQAVRGHYYKSLTTIDKTTREAWQSDYLTGLGYQMHLIQNMGQPNHVRNDTHIWDGASLVMGLETWAKRKDVGIIKNQILANITIPAVTVDLIARFSADSTKAPVANLFDTRSYLGSRPPSAAFNQGLAEYTNANFFSENTIFASEYSADDKHYQPYPRKDETNVQDFIAEQMALTTITNDEDFGPFDTFVVKKQTTSGEPLNCLATSGPFSRKLYQERGDDKYFYRSFMYDACFREYAEKLIPASAAYSMAMLEYFHRGKLTATYNLGEITFRSAKITVANATPNETAATGDVSLVIRDKTLSETPLGGDKYQLNLPGSDYTYKVVTLTGIDMSQTQLLTFDFGNEPLPLIFSDMTMQLVYKGKLGNEDGAVAVSELKPIDSIATDFALSLPQAGVYAKVAGESPGSAFTELRVDAVSDIPGGLSGGTFTLALEYRTAIDDQFQSVLVDTEPVNGAGYIYKATPNNVVTSLPQNTPVELVFNLAQLPVQATDLELNVIYTKADGTRFVGVRNISEPTPVDVYNNTDFTCLNGNWYKYDDPGAMAIVDSNGDGTADKSDIYPHTITNISFLPGPAGTSTLDATTSSTLFAPGPLPPGQKLRLGYILTDYANSYAYNETRTGQNGDPWPPVSANNRIFTGTGFQNDGNTQSGMFAFRGIKMWWGAGPVFINPEYQSSSSCGWDALNQKLGY